MARKASCEIEGWPLLRLVGPESPDLTSARWLIRRLQVALDRGRWFCLLIDLSKVGQTDFAVINLLADFADAHAEQITSLVTATGLVVPSVDAGASARVLQSLHQPREAFVTVRSVVEAESYLVPFVQELRTLDAMSELPGGAPVAQPKRYPLVTHLLPKSRA